MHRYLNVLNLVSGSQLIFLKLMPSSCTLLCATGTSNALTGTILKVVEDTPTEWHVFVCTLCSCYPSAIMGLPPHWYKVSFASNQWIEALHPQLQC